MPSSASQYERSSATCLALRACVSWLAVVISLMLGAVSTASADTIRLQWDRNSEPDVTGYVVYVGTQSRNYDRSFDVGNTDQFAFTEADPGRIYYFAVRAYFDGPILSDFSAEVSGAASAPPSLVNPGAQVHDVGQLVALQLQGTDTPGQTLAYDATGLPPGLLLTRSLGRIDGTPTTAGVYNVVVSVSDGALSTSQSFTWTIRSVTNTAPSLANPGNQTSDLQQPVSFQMQATDAAGQTLTFSATGLPTGLVMSASGRVTGSPSVAGAFNVTVSVSDGSLTASVSFTWTIRAPANTAPSLTNPGNQTSDLQQPVSLQLQATDAAGQTLTFSASGLPTGLVMSASGRVTGSPSVAGAFNVTVSVSDGSLTASVSFIWTIRAPANAAPTLINPGNQTSDLQQLVSLQMQATDAAGQTLTFSASGLPTGLVMSASGRVTGSPSVAGTFNVSVTVTDGSSSSSVSFTWFVRPPNAPPVLSSPGPQTTRVNEAITLQLQASDAAGQTLTFGASGLPPGIALVPATGRISGAATAAGSYAVTVSVSDGQLSATQSFTWTVVPALNQPGDDGEAAAGASPVPQAPPAGPSPGADESVSPSAPAAPAAPAPPADTQPGPSVPPSAPSAGADGAASPSTPSSPPAPAPPADAQPGPAVPPGAPAPDSPSAPAAPPASPGPSMPSAPQPDSEDSPSVPAAPVPPVPPDDTPSVDDASTPPSKPDGSSGETPSGGQPSPGTGGGDGGSTPPPDSSTAPPSPEPPSVPGSGTDATNDGADSGASAEEATAQNTPSAARTASARRSSTPAVRTGSVAVRVTKPRTTRELPIGKRRAARDVPQKPSGDPAAAPKGAPRTAARHVVGNATSSQSQTQSSVALPATRKASTAAAANDKSAQLQSAQSSAPGDKSTSAPVAGPNAPPTVVITTPLSRIEVKAGTPIILAATARDAEDGDLGARVVWTSSQTGRVAVGSSTHARLPRGVHRITATVTDGGNMSATAVVMVIVTGD